jgi:hypothetical protein
MRIVYKIIFRKLEGSDHLGDIGLDDRLTLKRVLGREHMKNAVFWNVAPSRYCVNRRFGETYQLKMRVEKSESEEPAWAGGCSETSVYTGSTRRHIPEDGILHSHLRENLKSYRACESFISIHLTQERNLHFFILSSQHGTSFRILTLKFRKVDRR